jgi:hypothetical protein
VTWRSGWTTTPASPWRHGWSADLGAGFVVRLSRLLYT